MSIIAWLILGLFAGFVSCKLHSRSRHGVLRDIVLGSVSALAGGRFLFSIFGSATVISFDAQSLVAAALGASLVLWIGHTVAGRRKP